MSEPRKNHLTIDGGQAKDDEHVASYKPIPEADTEFRTSKTSLHKSKEKVDEAEEKLLEKEDEAKITTRVDMADAKYVVGDHRNGDAKIELDANKRQFSGLTKEELMRYADDPFWVRLRWAMFVLFWALWLCMLAGAVAIIVQAPKCAPPPPKAWYEEFALVDASDAEWTDLQSELKLLKSAQVGGVFTQAVCGDNAYEVLKTPACLEQFKQLVDKAKDSGVKLIVDLIANYVPDTHEWFKLSENRTAPYEDYFLWRKPTELIVDLIANYVPDTHEWFKLSENRTAPYEDYFLWRKPTEYNGTAPYRPNNWVAVTNEPAWSYSEARKEFYLHQYGAGKADLNFTNPDVVKLFDDVLKTWMQAGAAGVRLVHARQLLVSGAFSDEGPRAATDPSRRGAAPALGDYGFYRHEHASDRPELDPLLAHFSQLVDDHSVQPGRAQSVFTLKESGPQAELYLLARNLSALRPPSAAPLRADEAPLAHAVLMRLGKARDKWPALQLTMSEASAGDDLAAFAYLLPATPVLTLSQIEEFNATGDSELGRLVALRADASIQHGNMSIAEVPSRNTTDPLVAVARWKPGHTGYVAVLNTHEVPLRANLTALSALPDTLTVHYASPDVARLTNYTNNKPVATDDVSVPAQSTVVLSFVPRTTAEQ